MKFSRHSYLDEIMSLKLKDFIVRENYSHHSSFALKTELSKSEETEYECQLNFGNTTTFIYTNEHSEIEGTIRVTEWNSRDELPIQKLFSINPLHYVSNKAYNVWHIGGFAIKKNRSVKVFKTLMLLSIREICKHKHSFALAECDSKLLRVLNLLGIETEILSDAIHYLGSETIPIKISYDSLNSFLNDNLDTLAQLPDSVVFPMIA
ncbi:MAG: hypothetical protein Q4G16_04530 [Cruoricaptor ignavus]|nr:hypothetical protein [Cruoricaptor ignavus]